MQRDKYANSQKLKKIYIKFKTKIPIVQDDVTETASFYNIYI